MLSLQIIFTITNYALATKLNVVHEWKYIDYLWDSEEQKNETISAKRYDYKLIFTIDVQKVPDGRVFVTTPAFNPQAVPATLSVVATEQGPGGPLLQPYPNWQWHNSSDCGGIISVWRVAIDDCGRLWVLDSGKIGNDQVCLAQLLLFDLRTDTLLQRIEIPNNVSHNSQNETLGLLLALAVENEGIDCKRTWVYIADVEGGGLVIFDGTDVWRIENEVFNPDPDPAASEFSIDGENFTIPDGLFGLALTPKASYYRFPSQAAGQAFSRDGILFFGLTTEIAIACWNFNAPMDDAHVIIVAQDNETLQFASGVKVSRHPHKPSQEELWVSTNRLQRIWTGTQNFNEINFRILKGSVKSLVKGSNCQLH